MPQSDKITEFRMRLTGRQTECWDALDDPAVDEVMYGGAKGGGKSVLACYWSWATANEIAKKYVPHRRSDPIPVGFMGRKIGKDFKETTLETWKRFIPHELYEIKGDPPVLIIRDRVKILTGGLDRREEINKFNSAELAFYVIDQAEETEYDDVSVLSAASHNRLIINGHCFPGKGLYTANPAQCWLKNDFILSPTKNRRFIQALPGDNEYLPAAYMRTLEDSFRHRPDLLKAYLFGDWDAFEGESQVIKDLWMREAFLRTDKRWPFIRRYLSIDCARFGKDDTVILVMENSDILDKVIMPYCKTTDISGRAARLSHIHGDCTVVVESTGADLGAGVIDELDDMGVETVQFNPSLPATRPDDFYSLRCEAWDNAAKIMCDGSMGENVVFTLTDHENPGESQRHGMDRITRGQLCSPQYFWRSGKFVVEYKEETKKRLGNSPDHADAYVIALWAWPYLEAEQSEESKKRRNRRSIKSPMQM